MQDLKKACQLLRYHILTSTTKAGSGHVTSSLSSVELMAVLFYKYFRFDLAKPQFIENDRLIFSKGHASPLFYSLYAVAGKVSEKEMMTLRQFDSVLEGHPTKRFKYTEVPTGSLGQGLSAGVGMALSAKMDKKDFLTYVLLGDGEMAEGQVWEALEIASNYKLNNLVGIVDVNRLGQTGQTLLGHDLVTLEGRIKSFGWRTYIINDGHSLEEIDKAYKYILDELPKGDSPFMILAKTIKGKGVSFLENKDGWHGRVLNESELGQALKEVGDIDKNLKMKVNRPNQVKIQPKTAAKGFGPKANLEYKVGDLIATREAYGRALTEFGELYNDIIVMDGDMSNSTKSYVFKEKYPERYFEMFIAEQNMTSVAMGLSERGKTPFISTFSSFWTRAYDQIRILNYSGNHVVFCGSHYGVSIGQDGPSQMGLEDVSMFRTLPNTTVFCPADAVSCRAIVKLMYENNGVNYMRITKYKTPVMYDTVNRFKVGGSQTLKQSKNDAVTLIGCGDVVFECIKACDKLGDEGIKARVIDAYCLKPIDTETIRKAAQETNAIITVEDHYLTGGLGDAVLDALATGSSTPVYKLGVGKTPKSGRPEELLEYEGISANDIIEKVKKILA